MNHVVTDVLANLFVSRIEAANLPSHFLREFKKQCPTCLATFRKRKALPGVAADIKEKQELSKWEMAYVDSSGKFSVISARGFHYYNVSCEEEAPSCSFSAVCEEGWRLAKSACQ